MFLVRVQGFITLNKCIEGEPFFNWAQLLKGHGTFAPWEIISDLVIVCAYDYCNRFEPQPHHLNDRSTEWAFPFHSIVITFLMGISVPFHCYYFFNHNNNYRASEKTNK